MSMTQPAVLRLEPAVTSHEFIDGNVTRHPEQHFLDFVINGHSLRESIDGADGIVTPLCRAWVPASVAETVASLLRTTEGSGQAGERVELLVCAVCGDVGCGAVTARVTVTPSVVTWSEFLWQDEVADGGTPGADSDGEANLVGLPPVLVFAHNQYTAAFDAAQERVAAFPYDELSHRGRRFLWPWQWGWRTPKP